MHVAYNIVANSDAIQLSVSAWLKNREQSHSHPGGKIGLLYQKLIVP
jgi:hypothetical protein